MAHDPSPEQAGEDQARIAHKEAIGFFRHGDTWARLCLDCGVEVVVSAILCPSCRVARVARDGDQAWRTLTRDLEALYPEGHWDGRKKRQPRTSEQGAANALPGPLFEGQLL